MTPTRILVVEDEGLIANDIANRLRHDGYHVAGIAASSREAFALLSETSPDIVLMDIRIKGELDGIETAERVREDFDVPVVFLTAHADRDTLDRAKVSQPFGYLVKPFRQVNLASTIEMAIHKHNTERHLRQRETWLSSVLVTSPSPTVVTDRLGIVRFVNPLASELAFAAPHLLAGRPFAEAFPLFDLKTGLPAGDLVAAAFRKGYSFDLPRGLALRRPGLDDLEVEGEISPNANEDFNPGVVITLRDCSRRAREEQAIRNEQKMLTAGRMAGGIAHDVNNLLCTVVGHSEELLAGSVGPAERETLQAISNAGQTAAEITTELLTLCSKPSAPKEPTAVHAVVSRVVALVSRTSDSSCRVVANLGSRSRFVDSVPGQLDRVLVNLILHAQNTMPCGGKITVATSTIDRETESLLGGHAIEEFARITVADTGPGLSAEALARVFEPFEYKSPGCQNGLDLVAVYSLVKEAAGEIDVFSTEGVGTTFEILIPTVPDPRDLEQSTAQRPVRPRLGTILLVEEDSMLRTMTHNHFESEGYNLLEASNGEEALLIADSYEGRIDFLVTEIRMPGMDGRTLADRLNATRPSTRNIFLSATPSAGSGDILEKPFSLYALQRKIREYEAQAERA